MNYSDNNIDSNAPKWKSDSFCFSPYVTVNTNQTAGDCTSSTVHNFGSLNFNQITINIHIIISKATII